MNKKVRNLGYLFLAIGFIFGIVAVFGLTASVPSDVSLYELVGRIQNYLIGMAISIGFLCVGGGLILWFRRKVRAKGL